MRMEQRDQQLARIRRMYDRLNPLQKLMWLSMVFTEHGSQYSLSPVKDFLRLITQKPNNLAAGYIVEQPCEFVEDERRWLL